MIEWSVRILALLQVLALPSIGSAQTFEYLGELGPWYWGTLSPDWVACGTGEIQSPVDFGKVPPTKHALRWSHSNTTGEIFNNGHTIEVETFAQNTLTLDGVAYELSQFHFHTASEHRVNDRRYDMELHLVHAAADGSNAVIGVFLKRATSSGALAPIFVALPDDLNVHHPLNARFDPASFLPASSAHFQYLGSLTTPPCTRGHDLVGHERHSDRVRRGHRPVRRAHSLQRAAGAASRPAAGPQSQPLTSRRRTRGSEVLAGEDIMMLTSRGPIPGAVAALTLAIAACGGAPAEHAWPPAAASPQVTTRLSVAPAPADPVWHYEGPGRAR